MTFLWSQALHHHISYSIFIWHVTEIKFIKHKRVMTLSNNNHVVRIEKHKKWGFRGFGCLLFKSCRSFALFTHDYVWWCITKKKVFLMTFYSNLHIGIFRVMHTGMQPQFVVWPQWKCDYWQLLPVSIMVLFEMALIYPFAPST